MNKIMFALFMCFLGIVSTQAAEQKDDSMRQIKIMVNGKILTAHFYDNITSNNLIEKMPFEIEMTNLYSRELCYRYKEELPTDNINYTDYQTGEIIYWPPMHSLVIMYKQNGEKFNMQKIGIIEDDIVFLENLSKTKVSFETIK